MKTTAETDSPGYEVTDASPRVIILTAAVLAVGVAVSLLAAAGYYLHHYGPLVENSDPPRETSFRDGPAQRTSVENEWTQLQADTRAHLEGYGWIDRSKGDVRIPVARAMELLAKESSTSASTPPGNPKGGNPP